MSRSKIELEFIFKASPAILYTFITTPACLVRWFSDAVDINDEIYSFEWEGSEEDAEMLDDIEEERIRFKWVDADDDEEYFEFRMYKSDITNETILEITDFCDKGDEQATRDLWTSQMNKLRMECGG
ncbi:MAG TPA: START-like domain-containing protein [Saprospiraceae bacterium]|nr:activator of HSP90 ATPase 1 family protein [Saprospiraceae bacterium]MCB9327810.1 activator of HSP90 ATPase 1 family protein [Lewinellaceae bacterium]HPK10251.1 START-like domain-containing protein [Saprospiraceae bacterium]HPQ22556.1 START-like domain-containing protein [Saprospiraceae bacterium]HRX27851.1 START-like domain-containing protein [Saprospiraceae bacterium]